MDLAHFNPEHVETYFLMLIGLAKSIVSPIRQWTVVTVTLNMSNN